jgi:hypothetical protein
VGAVGVYYGGQLLVKDAVTKPVPCSANPRWGQWLTFDDLLFSNVPRVRVHHHSTRPLFARVSFRANRVCVCGRVMLSFFRNRAFAAPSMRKRPERRTQFRLLGPTSTSSSTSLHASPHFCYIAKYAKHTCPHISYKHELRSGLHTLSMWPDGTLTTHASHALIIFFVYFLAERTNSYASLQDRPTRSAHAWVMRALRKPRSSHSSSTPFPSPSSFPPVRRPCLLLGPSLID